MNRAVRNRLGNLLLGAFGDPAKREAILRLALYCELSGDQGRVRVSVADFEAAWKSRHPEMAAHPQSFAEAAAQLKGLLEVRGVTDVLVQGVQGSEPENFVTPWYEPHPDLRPFMAAAGERLRIYAQVMREAGERVSALARLGPLRRGVAEAAICFNAGLFFEAHEHLEDHWRRLRSAPTKRFVQGIIQVSVGFHHAVRGSYQGAINQLGKGLEKLAAAPEDALGLDRDRFVREVDAVRQAIVAGGRQRMRQTALHEIPRMHLLP